MKTICCQCKVLIKDDGKADGQVSHGLCQIHAKEANDELDKMIAAQKKKGDNKL